MSLLGVSFSSIESATEDELAALAAPGVVEAFIDLGGNMITDTAPRPEIVDFKIVQDQPLIAGWSVLAHPLELEAYSARANQMQQPSFVRDLDSEFRDRDLFNSFRRCHSLIISGAPGFLEDGFLDPDSDFTYTNFRSLFGIAKSLSTPLPAGRPVTAGPNMKWNIGIFNILDRCRALHSPMPYPATSAPPMPRSLCTPVLLFKWISSI